MKFADRNLLLSLPLISVSAEVLKSFFETSPVMAIRNHLCMLIVLILFIRHFSKATAFNLSLVALAVYLLIMLMIQNAGFEPYNTWVTIFESKMMLPLSFLLLADDSSMQKISRNLMVTGSLFAGFILLFVVFHIGENQYGGTDGFTAGSFKFSRIYTGSFVLLGMPLAWLMMKKKSGRWWLGMLTVTILAILVLSTRRTSWIIVLTGMAVFGIYFFRWLPRMLGAVIGLAVVLLVLFPLYKETLLQQLEKRQHVFVEQNGFELESETRFEESIAVWEERIENPDLSIALFGEHLFDSVGHYDEGIHRERPLHLDINIMLHGGGMIGLILFILFYTELVIAFFRMRVRIKSIHQRVTEATFVSVVAAMILLTFSGGMAAVTHNMLASILAGACLARMYKDRKIQEHRLHHVVVKPMTFPEPAPNPFFR